MGRDGLRKAFPHSQRVSVGQNVRVVGSRLSSFGDPCWQRGVHDVVVLLGTRNDRRGSEKGLVRVEVELIIVIVCPGMNYIML